MSDRAKKISELASHSNAPANNLLVIVHQPGLANVETRKITVGNFFANVSSNVVFTARVNLPTATPPTESSNTGTVGEIRFDSDHIYICVANNTWKRATLSTW